MSITITENSCRVCLNEKEIMINLFDTVEDFQKQRLSDLLETCTDLKIDKSDSQPKLICDECTGELLVVAKFHDKCKRTVEILSQIHLTDDDEEDDADLKIEASRLEDEKNCDKDDSDVDDADSIIVEDHDEDDAEEEEARDNTSPAHIDDSLVFEEVDFVVEDISNDQIILFEPEAIEEGLEPESIEEHENRAIKQEHSDIVYASEQMKTPRTTFTARPLVINCKCVCGAGFTHVNNLSRHIQTHCPAEIFTCSICKHPFTTSLDLEKHTSEHETNDSTEIFEDVTKEESFDDCENVIVTDENSPREKLYVTTNDTIDKVTKEEPKKSKICYICNKRFVSKSALAAHLRIHTGDRPFQCSICPKAFKTQGGLALHLRRHSGVRPYTCNVCNKGFGESSNLRVHMRTHTGEKPHKCTICNRSFARVFLLQIHLRTHTGERPYQCPYCDKAFAQGGDLASHKRTHTGERPHVCPFCKKGFIKSSGLTQHMRKHANHETKLNDATYRISTTIKESKKDNFGFVLVDDDTENDVDSVKVEDYVMEFSNDIET